MIFYILYYFFSLKKGASLNWDLLIVSIMNSILSILGLPWMHGALPQAFLHLKSQADVEDRLVDGVLQQVLLIIKILSLRITCDFSKKIF